MNTLQSLWRNRLTRVISSLILSLLVAHWLTALITMQNPVYGAQSWAVWFDMDREHNVPTATNALLLFGSALISIGLALKARSSVQGAGWIGFFMFFAYLSLDELLIIHEQLAEPTRDLLNITGANPLYHAWVVPASFAVAVLALLAWMINRYHRQLKVFADTLRLVIIFAGIVILLEVLGTFVYDNTAFYRLIMIPLEEVFELSMAATILVTQHKRYTAK